MKICSSPITNINGINNRNSAINKTASVSVFDNLSKDIFIKNHTPSFGKSLRLEEKYFPFKKEIIEYCFKNSNINIEQIEKIIKKFSPTTSVKNIRELPPNTNVSDLTSAYFTNKLYFDADGKIFAGDKEIYLALPENNSKSAKLNFLNSLLHEMTHIFQEESKNRTSKVDFFNNLLHGKSPDSKDITTISSMPVAFSIAERNMYTPLYETLRKENFMPQPVIDCSKNMLDRIYIAKTGFDTKKFIELVINKTLDYTEKMKGPVNKSNVVKYISLVAGKEKEAYYNSTAFLKKAAGINSPTDLDLRVTLYDIFMEQAAQMARM